MPVITLEGEKLNKEQKSHGKRIYRNSIKQLWNIPKQAFTVLLKENEQDKRVGVGGHLYFRK